MNTYEGYISHIEVPQLSELRTTFSPEYCATRHTQFKNEFFLPFFSHNFFLRQPEIPLRVYQEFVCTHLSYAEGNYHLNFQCGFSKELYRCRAVFGLEQQAAKCFF
ncbi:uncharacterized protein EV154DRAFT_548867 [Mucor mucedo]|uniref:uncharacterized protein n=1 Tax=Mucor mucedo TaxID=29922 RepID=UPI002220E66F|nr:uncharacterized protein EV154DRAFT_548867 [Mucor mucedo]KAI7894719.1 hypothetical protein EV154DRAFT_548867 [Mucor mucedo]